MKHTETTIRTSDAFDLYMQSWQPDDLPKAVLGIVPGFGEHSGRYIYPADYLSAHGIAVYGVDLRGHGKSPGQRGHVDSWGDYREDVEAFTRELGKQHSERPHFLLGHSMGGLILLNTVLHGLESSETTIKGIIASSPLLASPSTVTPFSQAALRGLNKIVPKAKLATKLNGDMISRDLSECVRYVNDPLTHTMLSPRWACEAELAIKWNQEHAAEFPLPLLIYHGTGDQLVPIEGSRKFFASVEHEDKTLIEYPNGFHELHNDLDRELVFANLEEWIEARL